MPIAGRPLAGGHRVALPSRPVAERAARHSQALRTTTVRGSQGHSAGPQRWGRAPRECRHEL